MNKKVWIAIVIVAAAVAIIAVIWGTNGPSGKGIRIGAILPLSGDTAKYGKSAQRGIELAREEANSAGGIDGNVVEIIYEDSQGEPKVAVSAMKKLITVDKASFILGPLTSSNALAVASIANENRVIILSPAASSPKLTDAGDYVFRNVASDALEGRVLARHVRRKGDYRSVGVLYINNDFGIGLRQSFENEFRGLSGVIPIAESFEQGSTDFRLQLSKLKARKVDGIYLVGYREMARIIKQARELGITAPFFSIAMFEDAEILEIAGDAAEGVVYTYRSYDPKEGDVTARRFSERFKNKYGSDPGIFEGLSYDAFNILATAMRNTKLTVEEVKSKLYAMEDFPGVTGKTTFDQNGDVAKPISIKKVQNGKFEWIQRTESQRNTH